MARIPGTGSGALPPAARDAPVYPVTVVPASTTRSDAAAGPLAVAPLAPHPRPKSTNATIDGFPTAAY